MCQTRWFSVVAVILLLAGKFAYAQDFPSDGFPPDGTFQGDPPAGDGQMPGGSMDDMRDLIKWKKDHQSNARVQAFDKSHGELPRPTPGEAPDPSQFQKMQQYITDLKALRKTVEANPSSVSAPVKTPSVAPVFVVQAKPRQESVAQCQPAQNDVQTQLNDLQVQVVQLTAKLDVAQKTSQNFADRKNLPSGMSLPPGGPNGSASSDQDPEAKAEMQKHLVAQQVAQIKEQTQDLKDQTDDFKDKECAMLSGGGMSSGMGGPPPGMSDDDSDGPPPMASNSRMGDRPSGKGFDQQALLLDISDDLQSQIDSANRGRTNAKSRLRTAKRNWSRKCKEQASAQSPLKGGMGGMQGNGMSQMSMMGGMGSTGQMQMMGGGMPNFGGGMSQMSQMSMMGGMSGTSGMGMGGYSAYRSPYMGYSMPSYSSYGYGSMGGMSAMMPSMYSSSMYNPYFSMGTGGYSGYSPYSNMGYSSYGYGSGYGSYPSPYSTSGSYGYGSNYLYRGTSSYGSTYGNAGFKAF